MAGGNALSYDLQDESKKHFKSSVDDDDYAWPFSPLTMDAIENRLIPRFEASAMRPPINLLFDKYFKRYNHTINYNANLPLRIYHLRGEKGTPISREFLQRRFMLEDPYKMTSPTEIKFTSGFQDFVIPGAAWTQRSPILLPPSPDLKIRPPWELLDFKETSDLDAIIGANSTDSSARKLISASQEERLHWQACTTSSREPCTKASTEDAFIKRRIKLKDAYGPRYKEVKCCYDKRQHLADESVTTVCETNSSNDLSAIGNLNVLQKTADGQGAKIIYGVFPDASSRSSDFLKHAQNERMQKHLREEDVKKNIPTFLEVGFLQPHGGLQRLLHRQKLRALRNSTDSTQLLELSPIFESEVSAFDDEGAA